MYAFDECKLTPESCVMFISKSLTIVLKTVETLEKLTLFYSLFDQVTAKRNLKPKLGTTEDAEAAAPIDRSFAVESAIRTCGKPNQVAITDSLVLKSKLPRWKFEPPAVPKTAVGSSLIAFPKTAVESLK